MSRLRAKCPDCRTLTAVSIGPEYECHSCGRSFGAGLIRVPRAWGRGGEAMAEAASLPLPYPETGVIDEETLADQSLALALELPERPLVLGGCCCAHIGAIEALAARHGRVSVVWLDAHGDLNTVESSPSGNEWATPLRHVIDSDAVSAEDVALIGTRNLDPPEEDFIARAGVRLGQHAILKALDATAGVYVAIDFDVFSGGEVAPFMPEPEGLSVSDAERLLVSVQDANRVLGAGFTAMLPDGRNVEPARRLASALGL
ncbi:MAG: arginase family protein [Actinobacteria bacterium]|nr:arginase family protein [Actinomycetota bacterium]